MLKNPNVLSNRQRICYNGIELTNDLLRNTVELNKHIFNQIFILYNILMVKVVYFVKFFLEFNKVLS